MALSTNWFETGQAYISETDGDEANSGLTQALPKKILKQANLGGTPSTTVLRSGVYVLGIGDDLNLSQRTLSGDSGNARVYCDNINLIDGGNAGFATHYKNLKIYNIDIIDHTVASLGSPVRGNVIFTNTELNNVITFKYSSKYGDNTNVFSTNSLFKNVSTYTYLYTAGVASVQTTLFFKRCSFININTFNLSTPSFSYDEHTFNYIRCYFQTVNIVASGGSNGPVPLTINFNDCAFKDDVNIYGTNIQTRLGTADGVKATTTINVDNITINFTNCFWTATPGFNNEAGGDYSLMPSPSQSILYNNASIIGYKGIEYTYDSTHPAFNIANSGVSIDANIGTLGGLFTLDSGTTGTVTSTDDITQCITLPFATPLTDAIKVFGNFSYINAPLDTAERVDRDIFTATTNEEVRYTIEIQYLDEITELWNGSWLDIELDNIRGVETDNVNVGNGSPDFDISTGNPIEARRFRVRFTIRNNGN
jgi:hypothetical protein